MSQISRLRGSNALSAFRAAKLSQSVTAAVPRIAGIQAEFWHFAQLSRALSKDLKKRGFKFVGPTIVYAFMQAVGMVNDHLVTCYRHPDFKKR